MSTPTVTPSSQPAEPAAEPAHPLPDWVHSFDLFPRLAEVIDEPADVTFGPVCSGRDA